MSLLLFFCFSAFETHMLSLFWSLFRCYWMVHSFILLIIVSVLLKDALYHSLIVLFIVSELLKNTLYHSLLVRFIVSLLLKSTLFWSLFQCSGHYFSAVKEYIVSLFCSLFQGYWSIHCIIVLFTVSGLLKHTLCHCSVHCFSAIEGHIVSVLMPADSFSPGPLQVKEKETRHVVFTAETHNFPTGWFCHAGSVFVYLQTYKQLFSPMVVDWTSKHVSCTWAKSCQVAIIKYLCKDWKRFKKEKRSAIVKTKWNMSHDPICFAGQSINVPVLVS